MASSSKGGGESVFLSLLTVLFVGLKLTGFIDWSWWWVLSPIWIPLCLILLFFAAALAVAGISGWFNKKN